jgi:hypothetical protein
LTKDTDYRDRTQPSSNARHNTASESPSEPETELQTMSTNSVDSATKMPPNPGPPDRPDNDTNSTNPAHNTSANQTRSLSRMSTSSVDPRDWWPQTSHEGLLRWSQPNADPLTWPDIRWYIRLHYLFWLILQIATGISWGLPSGSAPEVAIALQLIIAGYILRRPVDAVARITSIKRRRKLGSDVKDTQA